jgi:CRP-like cAMP-binding protein
MTNRFIEKLRGLAPLDDGDVAALAAATAISRGMPTRRDLIREGDRPGPVFVVLEGWACRYKILPNGTRQVLAYLMPGDSCDLHIGLIAEMDHNIQTITAARVATIERAEMDRILDCHPRIAKALYISQLIDEGTLRAWITSMGRRTSIERVAHLMCELYLRARNIGLTAETELELPLSQLMLADSLGMTPVHLNRVLKTLRLSGAMTLKRGSLLIVDPLMLTEIAGFDENYLHRRLRAAA